jgi:hypothetical protein
VFLRVISWFILLFHSFCAKPHVNERNQSEIFRFRAIFLKSERSNRIRNVSMWIQSVLCRFRTFGADSERFDVNSERFDVNSQRFDINSECFDRNRDVSMRIQSVSI